MQSCAASSQAAEDSDEHQSKRQRNNETGRSITTSRLEAHRSCLTDKLGNYQSSMCIRCAKKIGDIPELVCTRGTSVSDNCASCEKKNKECLMVPVSLNPALEEVLKAADEYVTDVSELKLHKLLTLQKDLILGIDQLIKKDREKSARFLSNPFEASTDELVNAIASASTDFNRNNEAIRNLMQRQVEALERQAVAADHHNNTYERQCVLLEEIRDFARELSSSSVDPSRSDNVPLLSPAYALASQLDDSSSQSPEQIAIKSSPISEEEILNTTLLDQEVLHDGEPSEIKNNNHISLAAATATAAADAAGIDMSLLRVLCVRCAKRLTDPANVEDGASCEWQATHTKCEYCTVQKSQCDVIPPLAIPFARNLAAQYAKYQSSPSAPARDVVVAAAKEFVGWEATARKGGVAEVVAFLLDSAVIARQQLAESRESNRLLRLLLDAVHTGPVASSVASAATPVTTPLPVPSSHRQIHSRTLPNLGLNLGKAQGRRE